MGYPGDKANEQEPRPDQSAMPYVADLTEIIDAHHHLWDLDQVHYPWLMEKGVKRFFGDPTPIQENYLINDLQRDFGALPVKGSVHVQVGAALNDSVKETAWLQTTADSSQSKALPNAIVAFCDLAAANVDAILSQHRAYPNVRGVRQIVGRHSAEDAVTRSGELLENPIFQGNLRVLGNLELSFDLQLIPPQMPKAYELIKRAPNTKIALCHAGSPWDQSQSGFKHWANQIARLATLPNVFCKLSGFGMFDHQWNADSVRPLIHHAIDCFGVERCMFGSNFPVDKLYRGYAEVFDYYWQAVEGCSHDEVVRLFSGTAKGFYKIAI